jgi:hypothetical protein
MPESIEFTLDSGAKLTAKLCYTDEKPDFYDFYDEQGVCWNEGCPWHVYANTGPPSNEQVASAFKAGPL